MLLAVRPRITFQVQIDPTVMAVHKYKVVQALIPNPVRCRV